MPDLLRYWYLGTRARRHMVRRRFHEVDVELPRPLQGPVLDIGSAWGYNVMALSVLGVVAIGMDLVAEQFPTGSRIAAANDVPFRVLGGDAAALPFEDGTFRSVTMVETFEHIFEADRLGVLRECHRVLEPGGRIVLSTPNYSSLVERFKRLAVRHPSLQRRLPTMCYPADGSSRTAGRLRSDPGEGREHPAGPGPAGLRAPRRPPRPPARGSRVKGSARPSRGR